MKVLLINGSPNKNGCTNRALEEISNEFEKLEIDSEIFWIGKKPIGGCMACRQCAKIKKCVVDDIVNESREKFREADGFVFGSPVHFAAMAGSMTGFMDRLFYSESRSDPNTFRLKPVAGVLSARRAGTTAAFDQINKYFTISEMIVISSKYWNMVHGYTPQDVEQDLEGLLNMRILARNMAWFLKCKEAGEKSGIELPEIEPHVFINFIR
ncbi:MAG: flavodoxin family protein [Selenomonadaceae bacterium]|nr:flavodoxin family protein [Selenomonadaceae bacterium]